MAKKIKKNPNKRKKSGEKRIKAPKWIRDDIS